MVLTGESSIVSSLPLRMSVAWDPLGVSRLSPTVLLHFLYPPSSLGYNKVSLGVGHVTDNRFST